MKMPKISSWVAALFAAQFFAFGLFLPFFPVLLELRGLSAAEIGFLLGMGTIARIAAAPLFSNVSDKTGQRRVSILVYCLIATAFVVLFAAGTGLWTIGIAVVGHMVIKAPILPLSDAYALDTARNAGADYGRMRLWGSAGFVAATLVGGVLATETYSWLLLVLLGLASVATGAVAMLLPQQRHHGARQDRSDDGDDPPFKTVWFWLVLAVLGLFQGSHAAFYGFSTLYWQSLGFADLAIGFLWAIGVVAEIALFMVSGKLALRIDPPVFILVAGIAAVVRWGLFPFADTVPEMAALQLLHGLTFGAAHLGSIAILAKVVPSKWAGTGQGLLSASLGIQQAVGLAVSGALYQISKDLPFFAMSGVAAAGVLLVLVLSPLIRRKIADPG